MLRCQLLILALAGATLQAAMWPEQWGPWKRVDSKPAAVTDQALADEYGFEQAEEARYEGAAGASFTVTGWRFKDTTGAFAWYDSSRPAAARPSPLADQAVTTPDGALLHHGNYVVRIVGPLPEVGLLDLVVNRLPRLEAAALPPLIGFVPRKDLVPNSERYITGPVSLQRFAPSIPPSAVAFHFSTEGETASYKTADGTVELLLLEYPTPNLARAQLNEIQMVQGATVKRSGPLVAVVTKSSNPNASEKVLSLVKYQATVTWDEKPEIKQQNAGQLILDILVLAGILILLSVGAGVMFAGIRIFGRRFGTAGAGGTVTMLGLGEKQNQP